MKPILCVGMVCEDTIVQVDKFPIEDSDQRTEDQWKTRGGNASNMSTVLANFGRHVE
jgi:sugar/nucleoside kinase (ribokinase family)